MAAVAPAPSSLGPSEPSSHHRGSLAADLDDNSTLATEPSVPASIRTSISRLSSNLAALDLHSPHLPSQSGGASVASRASRSVRRGDVIRKMAPAMSPGRPAAPPPSVATSAGNGANAAPDVPALPAAIPAALVLAPERKLAPPKSKNPYAYADTYDLSPGSFQSSLETGALILPPALQTRLRLKNGEGGDGEGGDGATEDSPTSVAEGSIAPSVGEGGEPITLDARGNAVKASEGALVVHSHSNIEDEWQVVPAPSTNTQLVPAHPASGTPNPRLAVIPGEHPLVREHRLAQLRGRDPAEIVRDRTLVPYEGPADPPGESPELHPAVCGDVVVGKGGDCAGSQCSSYSGVSGRSGRGGGWRKVKWADPKSVTDEGSVDYAVLERYEALAAAGVTNKGCDRARIGGDALVPSPQSRALVPVDPPSSTPNANSNSSPHARHDPTLLRRNPRTRIATVSSGYKKARFFVREDLDTRIYFHQLEDAVGYMAARGYKRMGKAEEKGWRELLGRAHGVVKKGAKKEKQRYRKGKLVLVLKKTVRDHDDGEGDARTKAPSSRRRAERRVQRMIAGSQASAAAGTLTTTGAPASDASQATGRTSLGKSVRGPYKSYSEKFLAEQEEDKRQYLLAVAEGRPLPQIGYGSAPGEETLLLTDGSPHGSARGGDPEADLASNEASYGGAEAKGQRELHKSVSALSDRKGVYGGGVRYFTPDEEEEEDESEDESADDSADGTTEDDEDFAEEDDEYGEDEYTEDEETYTEGGTYDEATEYTQQSEEGTEVTGSDDSLFSEEEGATHDVTEGGGVESVDGSSSRGRRRKGDGPPRMEPIGDDDGSSVS